MPYGLPCLFAFSLRATAAVMDAKGVTVRHPRDVRIRGFSLRRRLHSDLAEVDDGRVVRAGELLVLGNFSQIAAGYDDYSV